MPVSLERLIEVVSAQKLATTGEIGEIAAETDDAKSWLELATKRGVLTPWQATQLLKGKKSFTLGKYLILNKLPDRHGHAAFMARHQQMDRTVEILASKQRESDTASFLANAGRLANLDHQNLQHTFDFDIESSTAYLVMEHTDGTPLSEKGPAYSPSDIVDFGKQMLVGVSYLHDRGFVHGELRADCVVVDKTRRIRIERIERIVDSKNHSQPSDDIEAVGEILRKLANGVAASSSASHLVPLKKLADQIATGKIDSARRAVDLLAQLNVTATPATRPATALPKKRRKAEPEAPRPTSSNGTLFLIAFLVIGVIIGVGGIGTLAYVLTRQKPVPVATQEDVDRWWEKEEDENSKPDTPAQDNGVANPDKDSPDLKPAVDKADAAAARSATKNERSENVDLSQVGVINAPKPVDETSESEIVDQPDEPPSTMSTDEASAADSSTVSGQPNAEATADKADAPVEPTDPFINLLDRVALSAPSKNEVLTFGKIDADAEPYVSLVVTKFAARGKSALQLVTTEKKNIWKIESKSSDDDTEEIALLAIHKGNLGFRWNGNAAKSPIAKQLQNCMLKLTANKFEHAIFLRPAAIELPKLVVSCDGPRYQRRIRISGMPPTEAVQFEVLEVSSEFKKVEISPRTAKFGDSISITATDKDATPVKFDLSIGKRGKVTLSLAPFLGSGNTDTWVPLTRKRFVAFGAPILSTYQALPEKKKQLTALRRKLYKNMNESEKKDLKAAHDAQLRIVESAYENFVATRALCDTLNESAQVRVRIFYTAGKQQIDLAVSPEFPSADPPKIE